MTQNIQAEGSPIPTRFEIYLSDDPETLAAKVSAFDGECCHVKIKGVVNADCWPELSRQIQEALTHIAEGMRQWPTK